MTLLKIAGWVMLVLGALIICLTLYLGRKRGTLEGIGELKRIRANGYIKEHKEETREDVYRREVISEQQRLLSRRAKRVLERMERENRTDDKQKGVAKGTSLLEEVSPAGRRPEPSAPKKEEPSVRDPGSDIQDESTGVLPDRKKKKGLRQDEGTAVLERNTSPEQGESTAILGDKGKSVPEEGTAVLVRKPSVNDDAERTGILPRDENKRFEQEATGILPGRDKGKAGEGTAVLERAVPEDPEGTAVLQREDPEKTDVLIR